LKWNVPTRTTLVLAGVLGLALVTACSRGQSSKPTVASATTVPAPSTMVAATPTPVATATVAAAMTPVLASVLRLPDTGQVTDYTRTFGEDADYTINPPSYADNGDGTVTDNVTGLMWQQRDGGEMAFASAAPYCQNLELAGRRDWRLPSSLELYSIVDSDHNPALNPVFLLDRTAEYWWTSQEQAGDSSKAWVVNAGGGTGAHPKSETISAGGNKHYHTRCVRGVPASLTPTLAANGDGTVTDQRTRLVWQQSEATQAITWEAALSYCEDLSLGARDHWRLPNIKELRSISDDTLVRPSLNTTYFPGAQAARYWSSTTLFGRAGSAWFVDFVSGLSSYADKTGQLSVRCVSGG
jgi:hypothetical protein